MLFMNNANAGASGIHLEDTRNSGDAVMQIKIGDWSTLGADARLVRHEVFVREQNVPAEIELDQYDAESIHAVAYDDLGRPVGTGRLLRDAHIGRMAVLAVCRGKGVGSRLLTSLIDEARRLHYPHVALSAQVHARAFYEAHGFMPEGEHYLDAGIEHVMMHRTLDAGAGTDTNAGADPHDNRQENSKATT